MEEELCLGFYNTSPLWVKEQFGITQFEFPDIAINKHVAKLIPERLRIGHKMEYIFEQLLFESKNWHVLAKNLLVDKNKERLGELDFIVYNKAKKKNHHIELAYKFYIINPDITEPVYRLMGPNKKDMFFTKLEKLKNKQFPLLFSKEIETQLNELHITPEEVKQEVCFKAQLFAPYKYDTFSIRPLNKDCLVGNWIRFDDFNTAEFKQYEYYVPYKQEWAIKPTLNRLYSSHYETLLDINLRMFKENTPMLWVKKPNGELEKLFVVWW